MAEPARPSSGPGSGSEVPVAGRDDSAELVALYDPHDPVGRVVGAVPRSRMRAENLPHAATGIIVRRSDGRLLVHRRSATKDLWPAHHDLACGGVLGAGEDPRSGALRELAEEVGIAAAPGTELPLRPLLTTWYRDHQTQGLVYLFETVWDGEVHFADGEVAQAWWMTPAEVDALLADPRRPVVPDTRTLFTLIEPAPALDPGPWPVGATALYRFGRQGRATVVRPATVLHDGPDELVLWIAEGTPTVRESARERVRESAREPVPRPGGNPAHSDDGPHRVSGRWRDRGIYVRIPARSAGWSLWHFFDGDGRLTGWYGNLEPPAVRRRTASGTLLVDTADHALDVWVPRPVVAGGPLRPQWRDEEEFAAFTGRPGRWTPEQAPAIRAAGEQLMSLARAGSPPFDGRWTSPPADPPPPAALPDDWDLPHMSG